MNERKYSMSQVIWINLWFFVLLLLVVASGMGYSQYRQVTLAHDRELVARLENVKLREEMELHQRRSSHLEKDVQEYEERFRGLEAENYQLRKQLREATDE